MFKYKKTSENKGKVILGGWIIIPSKHGSRSRQQATAILKFDTSKEENMIDKALCPPS